jgi:quinol monooxygenase YgiN
MSVTRINEFKATPGKRGELIDAFQAILPKIRHAKGCESCELLLSAEQQDKVFILEEWSDIPAHQAAAEIIAPKDFQRIMGLLGERPRGRFYTAVVGRSWPQ